MGTETQVTDTTQTGNEQDEAARQAAEAAAAASQGTASTEAEEQTEEQKQAAAKAAEEEAKKKSKREEESNYKRINRTIKELKTDSKIEREARHKAELEAAELRGRLAAMQEKGGAKEDPNAPPAEPNPEDFESIADFNKAMVKFTRDSIDYTARKIQADADKKIEEIRKSSQPAETPQQRAARETKEKVDTTLGKVALEFGEDAIDALMADPNITESVRDIILSKPETGHKVLGFLANHPEMTAKLAAMPVFDQVREIDKLEASIMTKRSTNAPAPVTTVAGKGVGSESIPDDTEGLAAFLSKKK